MGVQSWKWCVSPLSGMPHSWPNSSSSMVCQLLPSPHCYCLSKIHGHMINHSFPILFFQKLIHLLPLSNGHNISSSACARLCSQCLLLSALPRAFLLPGWKLLPIRVVLSSAFLPSPRCFSLMEHCLLH